MSLHIFLSRFVVLMKRFTAILLALIYLATTTGILINTHYCMGEVSGVAFGQKNNATCGTCGMDNEGCCHDDLQVIKLTADQHFSFISTDVPHAEALAADHQTEEQRSGLLFRQALKIRNHSPPLTYSRNTLFCVYRI